MKTDKEKIERISKKMSEIEYTKDDSLDYMFKKRVEQIYIPEKLSNSEVALIEIRMLWNFVDDALGSAVGLAGILEKYK